MRKFRHLTRGRKKIIAIITAIIIAIIVIDIIASIVTSFNDHTYVATVTKQERIMNSTNSYYLIFTKDDDGNYYEFKNEDNIFRFKFDSSKIYNQLEVGKKYEFTVVGFRFKPFSFYENIIKFNEVE